MIIGLSNLKLIGKILDPQGLGFNQFSNFPNLQMRSSPITPKKKYVIVGLCREGYIPTTSLDGRVTKLNNNDIQIVQEGISVSNWIATEMQNDPIEQAILDCHRIETCITEEITENNNNIGVLQEDKEKKYK